MKNMLCLTVYEAKGLEFDEVILFNFFQDSKCEGQWHLLHDVVPRQKVIVKSKDGIFMDFDMLNIPQPVDVSEGEGKQEEVKQDDGKEAKMDGTKMIDTMNLDEVVEEEDDRT